jgi:hypothetical protein
MRERERANWLRLTVRFLRDPHNNLAAIATIFCQYDRVAPVGSGTLDAVLSVFAPVPLAEFLRVRRLVCAQAFQRATLFTFETN